MLWLDRRKATISLMLTIAQCESDLEAERSQLSLHSLFQQLLDSNRDVSERLRNLEGIFETESVLTKCFRNGITDNVANDGDTSTPIGAKQSDLDELHRPRLYSHPFEIDLNTSRVYKGTQLYKLDVSFASSAVRRHAWSVFSDLSLSQISSISIIALPIYANDLYNNEWYTFTSFDHTGYTKRNSNGISASEIESNIHRLQATSNKMTCTLEDFRSVEAANQLRQPMRSYKILILGDEAARMLEFMLKFCCTGPHMPYHLDRYYQKQIGDSHQSYMIKVIDKFDRQKYPT